MRSIEHFTAAQDASTVESFAEFRALADALDQYVSNMEDAEHLSHGLIATERGKLDAARKMLERVNGVIAALAE